MKVDKHNGETNIANKHAHIKMANFFAYTYNFWRALPLKGQEHGQKNKKAHANTHTQKRRSVNAQQERVTCVEPLGFAVPFYEDAVVAIVGVNLVKFSMVQS